MMKRLSHILLITLLLSQVALTVLIVALSNRGSRQRLETYSIVERQEANGRELAVAVKSFECILLIQPDERTQAMIDACKDKARAELQASMK